MKGPYSTVRWNTEEEEKVPSPRGSWPRGASTRPRASAAGSPLPAPCACHTGQIPVLPQCAILVKSLLSLSYWSNSRAALVYSKIGQIMFKFCSDSVRIHLAKRLSCESLFPIPARAILGKFLRSSIDYKASMITDEKSLRGLLFY